MPSWKKVIVSGSDAILNDITLSGGISNTSGDFTLDVVGDINFDANGADIILKDDGTAFGRFKRDTSDFIIKSETNNKDIVFKGVDNSSTITAMTIDMSEGGNVILGGNISGSATSTGSFGRLEVTANTISIGGTEIDQTDAQNLGNTSGTNTGDITLAGGSKDFIQLSNQVVTVNQVDLTDDVTGVLPSANLDSDTAHLTTTQTFSGIKTFSAPITASLGVSGSASSTGSFGKVFVHGNILGNSDNTTEIGSTPDNGAIKKIYMVQGGEIAFGDTTTSNFFGIAEGTNNNFADSDTMGIYYRNGLNIYSANNTQRVKILANGNVGINDTTPSYKLDVNGTAQFVDDVTLGADISGSATSTGSFGMVMAGGTEIVSSPITALNNATANELVTVGSTTTELDAETLLTWNGSVLGVGITSPSIVGGIHVKNPASQNGVAVFESSDPYVNISLKDNQGSAFLQYGGSDAEWYFSNADFYLSATKVSGSATSTGSFGHLVIDKDAHIGEDLLADGDVVAYNSSDMRLKNNLQVIGGALDKIDGINGYEFDWNEQSPEWARERGHDVGVVAQEIQKIHPEIVEERKNGYLGVDYKRLVPLLIQSIKELKQEVEELKKKV